MGVVMRITSVGRLGLLLLLRDSLGLPVLDTCEDSPGNLLLQSKAQRRKATVHPWDLRNYVVLTSHKAGSHLLRNVMRRTFDVLGANSSCHYNANQRGAVVTSLDGQHVCADEKRPIRFQNCDNPDSILELRQEGEFRGVMITRDPLEMVTSAYVYHHRGAEPGSEAAPQGVRLMGPPVGVPATAATMWSTCLAMTKAYIVAGKEVLRVRYEDFTASAAEFNATVEKIVTFLFGDEITEEQKEKVMQSAQYEDINGPYGLNKSLDQIGEKDVKVNHTSDEDDLQKAREAVPLIPKKLYDGYGKLRIILGYGDF